MSKAKALSAVTKALVGTEKLAPEVESNARKFVSETGRINDGSLGSRRLLGDLLIGKRGVTGALKARYAQGGIFGPGGLVMGEFALDPRYKQLVSNYRQAPTGTAILDPYSGQIVSRSKATKKLVTKGLGQSISPMFLLGFPAMDVARAISTDPGDEHGGMSGILGALAGGAGFAMGGPLGLVGGMGASMLGEHVGTSVGSLFDPKNSRVSGVSPVHPTQHRLPQPNLILDAAIPL